MENVRESSGGKQAEAPPGPDRGKAPTNGDESSIWKELRARRAKASRRIGEGWERVAGSAKDYADDHSIRVAVSSLALGLALGALLGALIVRD